MRNQTYLTLLCLCLWASLFAQTTQYTGPAGGDWFVPGNWNNGVPESGDTALITGGFSVSVGNPLTVDFVINNFGEITATAAITNNDEINNGGTFTFSPTASLDNFGVFNNSGTASFTGLATFVNDPGAAFLNSGIFTLETLLDNQGSLTNNGMLDASGGTLLTGGDFNNNQTLTTQSLTILSTSTFTNNFGANLNVTGTGDGILVQGLLNNFGTISNDGGLVIENVLTNVGTLQSMDDVTVENGAQLINNGTLENQGTLTNSGAILNINLIVNEGFLNNFGQLINNNQIRNEPGGTVIIRPGSSLTMGFGSKIENDGDFDNRGNISSVGNILNKIGGQFSNSGIMENNPGSVLENDGTFTNTEDIFVGDVFRNDGTFINEDDLEINAGGVFTNTGSFLNDNGAAVTIRQDFFNEPGALFTNDGTFTVIVRASFGGNFVNNNLIDNQGDITLPAGGTLTNNADLEQNSGNLLNEGTLNNPGNLLSDECSTVHNKSNLDNGGSFVLQGILFQRGTLTGNPVNVIGGYVHTAANSDAPDICQNGTFGADINGDVKVYASELVAFANFDSCENIVYLANGEARPVFACSDIGSVLDVDLTLTTRLGDKLTCIAEVTPVDVLEPQFTTPCPPDVFVTTDDVSVAVSWTPPVAVDNCSATSLTSTHEPGDLFTAGNTTVTYTATDDYGNEGTCGFNVIVKGLTTCTQNISPADNETEVDFNTVTLTWAAAPNAILYDVYLGTANPPTDLAAPGVPATSATLTGLSENTVYYWYVVPRNLNGDATGCEANTTQFTTALGCDNVTNAGAIGTDQALCNENDPAILTSTAAASGGSSTLEYVWQKTTLDPFANPASWQNITGTNTANYDPDILTETTWYRRGARRAGCEDFIFTFPVKIEILEVPQPLLNVQQPDCGQPISAVTVTNLPANGYSRLDGSTPAPGQTTYTGIAAGQHVFTIGVSGCEVSTIFEINDFHTPPVAVCQNITRQLSGGSVTISASELDNGSTGTCLPLGFTVSGQPSLAFSCGDLGTASVTLQVTDALGGTATCTASITIEDSGNPAVTCKDVTVQLNAIGQASISPGDVFQSATDNCGIVNLQSVQPSTFGCGDVGPNQVILTVEDGSGNTATCTANVEVEEGSLPSISCKDITVQLDASGQASISPADVFENGGDNCGGVSLVSVQPNQFACGNIGDLTVLLTVQDGNGNLANCTATVTVEDNLAPAIFCKNTTVQLNANGQGSISPQDVFQSGFDNCGGVILQSVQPNMFNCSNIGTFPYLLTGRDVNGNVSTCTANVTVEDKLPPAVFCKNANVLLDGSGQATIVPADVLLSAADNCGNTDLVSVVPSVFDSNMSGDNTVTLTVTDQNGNTATCTAIVTVEANDNSVAAYLLLAQEEVHIHKNTVFGNVGVWKDGKEGKIHDNSTVNGFLKTPKEDVDNSSLVTEGYIAGNAPEPGTFKYNSFPDPENDTKVPDNYPGVYLLQGTHFKKIEIGKNSTAKFTATGEIFIKELKTKDADEGNQTSLLFSGVTELILKKKVEFGKRSAINADGAGCVKIYAEEDDVVIKENSVVNANIDVRFKDLKVDDSKADAPTILTGQFIAKKVDAGKYVEWEFQLFPCGQSSGTAPLMFNSDQIGFSATAVAEAVNLNWVTNTEYKNERFVIERSADGLNFEPLFEVESEKELEKDAVVYRDKDTKPIEGTNFYRVRVMLEDGTSLLSEIRLANVGLDPNALTVFPNPAQHHVSMYWEKYAGKTGAAVISNSFGHVLLEQQFESLPDAPVRFELGNLPEGLYVLRLKVDGHRERTARFVVAKAD